MDPTVTRLNRYNEYEKQLLYSLFDEYKETIDINLRRSTQYKRQSDVRECWNEICDRFNADKKTVNRNLKQIQKFWLNSKLRNQLPFIRSVKKEEASDRTSEDDQISYKLQYVDYDNFDDYDYVEYKVDPSMNKPGDGFREGTTVQIAYDSTPVAHYKLNLEDDDAPTAIPTSTYSYNTVSPIPIKLATIQANVVHDHSHRRAKPKQIKQEYPQQQQVTQSQSQPRQDHEIIIEHEPDDELEMDEDDSHHPIEMVELADGNVIDDQSIRHTEELRRLQIEEMKNRVLESKMRCKVQEMYLAKARMELKNESDVHKMRIKEMELKLEQMKKPRVY